MLDHLMVSLLFLRAVVKNVFKDRAIFTIWNLHLYDLLWLGRLVTNAIFFEVDFKNIAKNCDPYNDQTSSKPFSVMTKDFELTTELDAKELLNYKQV